MKAADLEVGGAYILPVFRTPAWRDHVGWCARVTVVEKDLYNGAVVVDVERPGPHGLWGPERTTVRTMRIVAPWAETAEVERRQVERIEREVDAERERRARHDMVAAMLGRLSSLSADDVDVSFDGKRVTLALGAFLGMAGLAAKALS
jgi:hypothetical protein